MCVCVCACVCVWVCACCVCVRVCVCVCMYMCFARVLARPCNVTRFGRQKLALYWQFFPGEVRGSSTLRYVMPQRISTDAQD